MQCIKYTLLSMSHSIYTHNTNITQGSSEQKRLIHTLQCYVSCISDISELLLIVVGIYDIAFNELVAF